MAAFTGFNSDSYNTLANSLSGLGQQFGRAYQEQGKQQNRMLLGDLVGQGNYKLAAQQALAGGVLETGTQLLGLADKQNQRELDAKAIASVNGGAASPSAQPSGPVVANDEVSKLIVQKAQEKGIDPGIALKVFRSEGAGGYTGDGGSSFGPFQLHYGGVAKGGNAVGGLGDEFTKQTGLDARDPKTVPQQIDFALSHAQKNGWGAWHGWKGDAMAGIGGKPVQVADASGRIPQSGQIDALMGKRNSIMNALSSQSISDNARQQLNVQLQDTQFQIERLDKQAANVPEFNKKMDAKLADRFDAISTERDSALSEKAMIDQLGELGNSFDTGASAAAQAWLGKYGINLGPNAGKIQAYEAIVNKLIPMQRIPGAGSTSDFDAKGFAASLPSLMKTPEGNKQIIATLNALNEYKVSRGDIADKVSTGEMSPAEGLKALRSLKAPSIPKAAEASKNVPAGFNTDLADFNRAIKLHPEREQEFRDRLAKQYPGQKF